MLAGVKTTLQDVQVGTHAEVFEGALKYRAGVALCVAVHLYLANRTHCECPVQSFLVSVMQVRKQILKHQQPRTCHITLARVSFSCAPSGCG